jgi:uncharacterized phage protein (TIGR01671 family)
MRIIKFRAWSVGRKEMEIVSGLYWFEENYFHSTIDNNGYILMQYTGLKDKNGVEIYEGDIVEIERRYGRVPIVAECKYFCSNVCGFSLVNKNGTYSVGYSGSAVVGRKVIGSIYENPELLK